MDIETFKKDILIHKDRLFRLAASIMKNPMLARDVVQEVLIKVWQKQPSLSHIQNVEAWLVTSTRNKAIDTLRGQRKGHIEIESVHGIADNLPNPASSLEQQDTAQMIRQIIKQLPENQRMVLHLRDIEGMTYQEISDMLDMSLPQVKTNLFRARQKLKSIISKAYANEF